LADHLADQLNLFIKDYDVCLIVAKLYIQMRKIDATEECREFYMSRRLSYHHPLRSKICRQDLIYLASERGIRDVPSFRIYAAAWSIKNLDKGNITIKDKLEDIKLIPYTFVDLVNAKAENPYL